MPATRGFRCDFCTVLIHRSRVVKFKHGLADNAVCSEACKQSVLSGVFDPK